MKSIQLPTDPPSYPSAGPVPEELERTCEHCGYSLTGLVEHRCPECGAPFNAFVLPGANIPWLKAKHTGRVRAFLLTLLQILFSPSRFANGICRAPRIDVREAACFRKYCLMLGAYGTSAVCMASLFLNHLASRLIHSSGILSILILGVMITVPAWVLLFIGSAVPVAIRDAGSREDRSGQCLAHYACANAVLLPLIIALLWIGVGSGIDAIAVSAVVAFFLLTWWLRLVFAHIAYKLDLFGMVVAIAVLVFWWMVTVVMAWVTCIILGLFLMVTLGAR